MKKVFHDYKMNLVVVILVAIILWFVWMLLQSYRNLEKELREIRVKCVMGGSPDRPDPVESAKATVVSGLSRLASSI